jgi:membrane-associated phospholipid phosphatase
MHISPLLAVSILFFALADLWLAFPQIDLAVAGLFWTAEGGFSARGTPWEQFLYASIEEVLVLVCLGLIAGWGLGRWRATKTLGATRADAIPAENGRCDATKTPGQSDGEASSQLAARAAGASSISRDHRDLRTLTDPPEARTMRVGLTRRGDLRFIEPRKAGRGARITGRQLSFLLILLALVPGLLINQVFKEHWGRARPIQLEQFGGDRTFSPAFVPSDQGGGAFSSGHVAAAAWLVAVAVVLFGVQSRWTGLALLYLIAMMIARMAAGAHFLSDTLTSMMLVWLGFLIPQRIPPLDAGVSIQGRLAGSQQADGAAQGLTRISDQRTDR